MFRQYQTPLVAARGHPLLDYRPATRKQHAEPLYVSLVHTTLDLIIVVWNKYLCNRHFVLLFSLSPIGRYLALTTFALHDLLNLLNNST